MPTYYLNDRPQPTGEHEVHESTCAWMPELSNQIYLGVHDSCHEAMVEARKKRSNVDGCVHCCIQCHTR